RRGALPEVPGPVPIGAVAGNAGAGCTAALAGARQLLHYGAVVPDGHAFRETVSAADAEGRRPAELPGGREDAHRLLAGLAGSLAGKNRASAPIVDHVQGGADPRITDPLGRRLHRRRERLELSHPHPPAYPFDALTHK